MKINFLLISFIFLLNGKISGQVLPVKYVGAFGEEDWTRGWTNYKPNGITYISPNIILSSLIDKNTTLYKKNTYLLSGVVYVTNNAVLTIEPGTVVRGDFNS